MNSAEPGSPCRTRAARWVLAREDGTTIPLILGFFVLALYMVAGSIAASDAFLDQRNLQSACDGAALAGANALDPTSVYGSDLGSRSTLPVGVVEDAVAGYLYDDPALAGIQIESIELGDGSAVRLGCSQRMDLAFGYLFGRPSGITHHVTATSRSRLGSAG